MNADTLVTLVTRHTRPFTYFLEHFLLFLDHKVDDKYE